MKLDLTGRCALVGGGTSGIGWAIARQFAGAGARVVIVARTEERLRSRLVELTQLSDSQHEALCADYDTPDSIESLIERLHTKALIPDIIVNNAGGPQPGPIIEAAKEEFHRALDRLLLASHLLVRYALPQMCSRRWGRILNVISTSVRQPIEGLGVSNTIRAATAAWAKTLATEVAPYGITVNSILPGATRTERLHELISLRAAARGVQPSVIEEEMLREIPLGRFAEADEVAALALFLCSDVAGYITGECIRIDGGRTRCL
jgi:3-oxoacyl-[acyl-carrier protein] reductase